MAAATGKSEGSPLRDTAESGSDENLQARLRVWNYPIREQYNTIHDNAIKLDSVQEGLARV